LTSFSASILLQKRKVIRPVRNLCHLSPKVLFWNKWRNKTRWNQLTQVHLENCHVKTDVVVALVIIITTL